MAARLFPGWIVVGGAFLALFISFGSMYAFAAFFADLEREFAATRADIALIFAIAGFLYFTVGAVSGSLADHIGVRPVVATGVVLLAAGLLLAGRAQSLFGVYVFYGLGIGLGVGFMYVPALGAVQRWFERRRGFASGLAVTGIGVGTLVMPLIAAWLISQQGWRGAYATMALCALLLGVVAVVLLEHGPQRRGLHPDGVAPDPQVAPKAGASLREALHSRPFWLLYAAGIATSFGMFMPFVHLTPYARDLGLSESFGVLLISLLGVGSAVGRFALGGFADRIGRRQGSALMFLGMALMLLVWLLASGPLLLVVFALLFGTFYGGFVALIPALTADYFGGRRVSGIIGCLYSGVGLGTLFGPTLAGLAFDLSGSYAVPIIAGAAANLVAMACVYWAEEPALFRAAAAEA